MAIIRDLHQGRLVLRSQTTIWNKTNHRVNSLLGVFELKEIDDIERVGIPSNYHMLSPRAKLIIINRRIDEACDDKTDLV